jgi:hypothetical protein
MLLFVILNEVKNPAGHDRNVQHDRTGFFATLRMTRRLYLVLFQRYALDRMDRMQTAEFFAPYHSVYFVHSV